MSGDSISENWTAENRDLRLHLESLVAQARLNEQVMRRFQDAELRMLSVGSFKELLQYVLQEMKETFDLDVVTLALIDPEYEVRRMLADIGLSEADFPGLMCLENPSRFHRLCGSSMVPVLGQYNVASRAPFFPRNNPPASIAILPMVRQKRLIGSLNLGSRNEDRFAPGMATDFIGRLAAIAGVCLENVTNSERLKHLGLTDPLTGVHNRRYFDQRLQEAAQLIEHTTVSFRSRIRELVVGAERAMQEQLSAIERLRHRARVGQRELPSSMFLELEAE